MNLDKYTIRLGGFSFDDLDENTVLTLAEEETEVCQCGHESMLRSYEAIVQHYQSMIRELTMTPEQRREEVRNKERAALGLPPLTKEEEYNKIVTMFNLSEESAADLAKQMNLVLDWNN